MPAGRKTPTQTQLNSCILGILLVNELSVSAFLSEFSNFCVTLIGLEALGCNSVQHLIKLISGVTETDKNSANVNRDNAIPLVGTGLLRTRNNILSITSDKLHCFPPVMFCETQGYVVC